jgi:hypothetical protein
LSRVEKLGTFDKLQAICQIRERAYISDGSKGRLRVTLWAAAILTIVFVVYKGTGFTLDDSSLNGLQAPENTSTQLIPHIEK